MGERHALFSTSNTGGNGIQHFGRLRRVSKGGTLEGKKTGKYFVCCSIGNARLSVWMSHAGEHVVIVTEPNGNPRKTIVRVR